MSTNTTNAAVKRMHNIGGHLRADPDGTLVSASDFDAMKNHRDDLREALENVLGFCATIQGMEAEMAIADARLALSTPATCPACNGAKGQDKFDGYAHRWVMCRECDGTGRALSTPAATSAATAVQS